MPLLLLHVIQALNVLSSTSLPWIILGKLYATPFITSHTGIECIELYFPPLAYIDQKDATPFITSHSGIECNELYFHPLAYIEPKKCHSFYYKPFRH